MSFNNHGLYFDLQLHTSVLSWFRYSDSFPKLVHLLLNQLICDTPSILKSNFPFSSSLPEQTARWVSKPWLNSEECSLPFMGTSLNVHNLRIISSLKPAVHAGNLLSVSASPHMGSSVSQSLKLGQFAVSQLVSVCYLRMCFACCCSLVGLLRSSDTRSCRFLFSLSSVLTLLPPKRTDTSAMLVVAVVAAPSVSVCTSSWLGGVPAVPLLSAPATLPLPL